jgi:hypothetical protein
VDEFFLKPYEEAAVPATADGTGAPGEAAERKPEPKGSRPRVAALLGGGKR